MTFGILALLVAAGLAGPILTLTNHRAPPVVVGELVAGIVIGPAALGWLHTDDPTLQLLADVGFAMLMFIVGTHLPLHEGGLKPALGRGALLALTTAGLGIVGGFAAWPLGLHRPGLVAVLAASCSAAVVLPVLQDMQLPSRTAMVLTAWVAIADVAAVLAVPIVMATGSTLRVAAGGVLVVVGAAVTVLLARSVLQLGALRRLRVASHERGWALDLRLSLLILFALAWLATRFGTSVLLAGFASGAAVAVLGPPRRVAQQLIGLGEGFFVPLFYVDLGARLDIGGLWHSPRTVLVGLGLMATATAVHVGTALAWRMPIGAGLMATAQLGVPSAVVTIGLRAGVLTSAQATSIMAAVLGSLALCAVGAAMLGHSPRLTDHAAPRARIDPSPS